MPPQQAAEKKKRQQAAAVQGAPHPNVQTRVVAFQARYDRVADGDRSRTMVSVIVSANTSAYGPKGRESKAQGFSLGSSGFHAKRPERPREPHISRPQHQEIASADASGTGQCNPSNYSIPQFLLSPKHFIFFDMAIQNNHCGVVYHVKQSNNATSWLAIPNALNLSLRERWLTNP